jgi:hypothetical protein
MRNVLSMNEFPEKHISAEENEGMESTPELDIAETLVMDR